MQCSTQCTLQRQQGADSNVCKSINCENETYSMVHFPRTQPKH